jgi:hypothetical protein
MSEPATPSLAVLAALLAAGLLAVLGWAWWSRQRWRLAREKALAERFRAERDEAQQAL